jgi:hypothetical protein
MEHIRNYHIHKVNKKSTFVENIDVQQLIKDILAHPIMVRQHEKKPNRLWYMGNFSTVIGHRGTDQAECHWVAVLVDQHHLITAYPIVHPKSIKFMCS